MPRNRVGSHRHASGGQRYSHQHYKQARPVYQKQVAVLQRTDEAKSKKQTEIKKPAAKLKPESQNDSFQARPQDTGASQETEAPKEAPVKEFKPSVIKLTKETAEKENKAILDWLQDEKRNGELFKVNLNGEETFVYTTNKNGQFTRKISDPKHKAKYPKTNGWRELNSSEKALFTSATKPQAESPKPAVVANREEKPKTEEERIAENKKLVKEYAASDDEAKQLEALRRSAHLEPSDLEKLAESDHFFVLQGVVEAKQTSHEAKEKALTKMVSKFPDSWWGLRFAAENTSNPETLAAIVKESKDPRVLVEVSKNQFASEETHAAAAKARGVDYDEKFSKMSVDDIKQHFAQTWFQDASLLAAFARSKREDVYEFRRQLVKQHKLPAYIKKPMLEEMAKPFPDLISDNKQRIFAFNDGKGNYHSDPIKLPENVQSIEFKGNGRSYGTFKWERGTEIKDEKNGEFHISKDGNMKFKPGMYLITKARLTHGRIREAEHFVAHTRVTKRTDQNHKVMLSDNNIYRGSTFNGPPRVEQNRYNNKLLIPITPRTFGRTMIHSIKANGEEVANDFQLTNDEGFTKDVSEGIRYFVSGVEAGPPGHLVVDPEVYGKGSSFEISYGDKTRPSTMKFTIE